MRVSSGLPRVCAYPVTVSTDNFTLGYFGKDFRKSHSVPSHITDIKRFISEMVKIHDKRRVLYTTINTRLGFVTIDKFVQQCISFFSLSKVSFFVDSIVILPVRTVARAAVAIVHFSRSRLTAWTNFCFHFGYIHYNISNIKSQGDF